MPFDSVFHLTELPEFFRAGGNVYITMTSGKSVLRAVCPVDEFRAGIDRAIGVFTPPACAGVVPLKPRGKP